MLSRSSPAYEEVYQEYQQVYQEYQNVKEWIVI